MTKRASARTAKSTSVSKNTVWWKLYFENKNKNSNILFSKKMRAKNQKPCFSCNSHLSLFHYFFMQIFFNFPFSPSPKILGFPQRISQNYQISNKMTPIKGILPQIKLFLKLVLLSFNLLQNELSNCKTPQIKLEGFF